MKDVEKTADKLVAGPEYTTVRTADLLALRLRLAMLADALAELRSR